MEELSDVGGRFPNNVKALVYLESGYSYAFYDEAHPQPSHCTKPSKIRAKRDLSVRSTADAPLGTQHASRIAIGFEHESSSARKDSGLPNASFFANRNTIRDFGSDFWSYALSSAGYLRMPPLSERMRQIAEDQVKAFEYAMPQAKIVPLEKADHYVYVSDEPNVIREMTAFLTNISPK